LFKLIRLCRILKIIKEKEKVIKIIKEIFKIEMGSERLLFALLLFVTIIHINACLWVFIAKSSGKTTNWIEKGNF